MCMQGTFKGKDCRMLQTLAKVMLAVKKRDEVARDPKPTTKISTRALCFTDAATGDLDPSFGPILDLAVNLCDHVPF